MADDIAVSVIIVNRNGKRDIDDCLTSLANDGSKVEREIIFVDNASDDGSPELAEKYSSRFSRMKVVRSPVGRGYAGGVNLGLTVASGKYVAVLSIDLVMEPGWLDPLVRHMEDYPETGAVCPLLLLYDDASLINATGQNIHITGLGFNRGLGKPKESAGTSPIPINGLQGAVFLIRRGILDRMGGWDESGFLYHEDVEISWMLHLLGYQMFCIPQSVVLHKYALSMSPGKFFLLERNRCMLLLTHLEVGTLFLLSPWLFLTEAMAWGFGFLRGISFVASKGRSYRELFQKRAWIKQRRAEIGRLRNKSDWSVLKRLSWNYTWGQGLSLGVGKSKSTVRGSI